MIAHRINLGVGLFLGLVVFPSIVCAQNSYESALPSPIIIQSAPPHALLEMPKPVEAVGLSDINPESIGLLAASDGGLGAALWKGTSRAVVEKLLPTLTVPLSFPSLNGLARRFLMSTTAAPEGPSAMAQSLLSLRILKLVMLGDVVDGWKLATLTKPDLLTEVAQRLSLEALLVTPQATIDVCSLLPNIIKNHNTPDWQKILVVCQLRAKDYKAAQLSLDLLHSQDIKDDLFFTLAEKNIIGGSKQLPKQLSPLNAVTTSLLQLTGLDVPSEVFTHPDAVLTHALLSLPTKDEDARISFAETAAAQGLLTTPDLENVYKSVSALPVTTSKNQIPVETAPHKRALLYQQASQESNVELRISAAQKFLELAPPTLLQGTGGNVLVDMVNVGSPTPELYGVAPFMVHIHLLAGKISTAMEWLKWAKEGTATLPDLASEIQKLWPFLVLSGLESEHDYALNRDRWLDVMLHAPDISKDNKSPRQQAASILLLLDAEGFMVTDNDWTKVLGATPDSNHTVTSALISQRLSTAALANRRGETILLSLIAASELNDAASQTVLDIIRALRLVGLNGDASELAREAALSILYAQPGVH